MRAQWRTLILGWRSSGFAFPERDADAMAHTHAVLAKPTSRSPRTTSAARFCSAKAGRPGPGRRGRGRSASSGWNRPREAAAVGRSGVRLASTRPPVRSLLPASATPHGWRARAWSRGPGRPGRARAGNGPKKPRQAGGPGSASQPPGCKFAPCCPLLQRPEGRGPKPGRGPLAALGELGLKTAPRRRGSLAARRPSRNRKVASSTPTARFCSSPRLEGPGLALAMGAPAAQGMLGKRAQEAAAAWRPGLRIATTRSQTQSLLPVPATA
jgi:hypothetical protein